MTIEEAVRSLELKFTSGNSISVELATITRREWEAIREVLLSATGPETVIECSLK